MFKYKRLVKLLNKQVLHNNHRRGYGYRGGRYAGGTGSIKHRVFAALATMVLNQLRRR
jgi:hypothetical protein